MSGVDETSDWVDDARGSRAAHNVLKGLSRLLLAGSRAPAGPREASAAPAPAEGSPVGVVARCMTSALGGSQAIASDCSTIDYSIILRDSEAKECIPTIGKQTTPRH